MYLKLCSVSIVRCVVHHMVRLHAAVHGIQLMSAHLVVGDALDVVAPAAGEFDSGLPTLDARVHRQHWLGLGLGLRLGLGLGLKFRVISRVRVRVRVKARARAS